jgi:hypothetical protein
VDKPYLNNLIVRLAAEEYQLQLRVEKALVENDYESAMKADIKRRTLAHVRRIAGE